MKLQSQVCSLEQAKRLKALGIIQESLSVWTTWIGSQEIELWAINEVDLFKEEIIAAAFNVSELGVMLPNEYITWATHIRPLNKGTYCHVVYETNPWGAYETEARGRAALLIYLLENNLITPEEVNNRLLKS